MKNVISDSLSCFKSDIDVTVIDGFRGVVDVVLDIRAVCGRFLLIVADGCVRMVSGSGDDVMHLAEAGLAIACFFLLSFGVPGLNSNGVIIGDGVFKKCLLLRNDAAYCESTLSILRYEDEEDEDEDESFGS